MERDTRFVHAEDSSFQSRRVAENITSQRTPEWHWTCWWREEEQSRTPSRRSWRGSKVQARRWSCVDLPTKTGESQRRTRSRKGPQRSQRSFRKSAPPFLGECSRRKLQRRLWRGGNLNETRARQEEWLKASLRWWMQGYGDGTTNRCASWRVAAHSGGTSGGSTSLSASELDTAQHVVKEYEDWEGKEAREGLRRWQETIGGAFPFRVTALTSALTKDKEVRKETTMEEQLR